MIKSKDLAAIKEGKMTVDTLLENYPVKALVSDLVELVMQKDVIPAKPIVLSDEEYDRVMGMFRKRGVNAVGELIKRGRPKKEELGEKLGE